jgi:hypothetical protein
LDTGEVLLLIGMEEPEAERALEAYATHLWSAIDEAMEGLWLSDEEKEDAVDCFSVSALLVQPLQEVALGTVALVDIDADLAAEFISANTGCKAVAFQAPTADTAKAVAFDAGRQVCWLFWALGDGAIGDEIVSGTVAAAQAAGGVLGDPGALDKFMGDSAVFAELCGYEWTSSFDLMAGFLYAMGFELPEVASVKGMHEMR